MAAANLTFVGDTLVDVMCPATGHCAIPGVQTWYFTVGSIVCVMSSKRPAPLSNGRGVCCDPWLPSVRSLRHTHAPVRCGAVGWLSAADGTKAQACGHASPPHDPVVR